MSATTGVYRLNKNGAEYAFIDKGVGVHLGIPRAQYEEKVYQPPFDSLPGK